VENFGRKPRFEARRTRKKAHAEIPNRFPARPDKDSGLKRLCPGNYSVNQGFFRHNIIGRNKSRSRPFSFVACFATLLRAHFMFIPLKDLNPSRTYPFVNITLILANIAVFLYEVNLEATLPRGAFDALLLAYSTVPARFPAFLAGRVAFDVSFVPLVTSMFLHSGFLHIAGNMLFLWIFGDNVEDFFGHFTYFFFYMVCGIGAGLLHVLFNFHSNIPAIGASGAISGVMGAYILLYPRARILTLVFIFPLPVPAVIFLGLWYVLQFLAGISSIGAKVTGGVAVWAHIGGFLLGMLLTSLAKRR